VQDSGRPLFLSDGRFSGYIGSCVDIEDRKQIEAMQQETITRMAHARDTAQEASRLKDEFLAIVSHELRTPLNAILGWTQLLKGGTLSGDARVKALDTIERNARAQSRLVEDLLDVSRIVSGKLHLRLEPADLVAVVRAAIDAVKPSASDKSLELRCTAPDAVSITADPGRLQQAIWNLLSNAIKFTPSGGHVEVAVRGTDAHASVVVRDTGVGIPSHALPYIFDRFRQADSRTTRVHGGLGLGLAIVHHIAAAHGGSVHVTSDGEGQGATFELVLPVRTSRDLPVSVTNLPEDAPTPLADPH
jgi:signal transduction histidine kinase